MTKAVESEVNRCKTRIDCKTIVTKKSANPNYDETLDYLQRRYPSLHKGELSSFLLAYMDYAANEKSYYFVTDDQLMRKRIAQILDDPRLIEITGRHINNFNQTGTVGLVIHLVNEGMIQKDEAKGILNDLERSSFYLKSSVLDGLRDIALN